MYEDLNKVVVMISVIVLTNGRFKHLIPRVTEKQQSHDSVSKSKARRCVSAAALGEMENKCLSQRKAQLINP